MRVTVHWDVTCLSSLGIFAWCFTVFVNSSTAVIQLKEECYHNVMYSIMSVFKISQLHNYIQDTKHTDNTVEKHSVTVLFSHYAQCLKVQK
jgi:hypothetical protein